MSAITQHEIAMIQSKLRELTNDIVALHAPERYITDLETAKALRHMAGGWEEAQRQLYRVNDQFILELIARSTGPE